MRCCTVASVSWMSSAVMSICNSSSRPKPDWRRIVVFARLAEDPDYWQQKSSRGREIFSELPDAGQKWALQKGVITRVAGL